eukprot:TRINITY_DN22657_c0_g1_i2.p1 TRINITY_DN22657_c0_g1~~TRINITY_DN22657_c0_g1_i2.p1  ORF type:complete len:473 (-),score=88.14 TRINITY_DN22657_c0_g1_i2:65-1483(-)
MTQMLPPEPPRSRAVELAREQRVPFKDPWAGACPRQASDTLKQVLSARRARHQEAAELERKRRYNRLAVERVLKDLESPHVSREDRSYIREREHVDETPLSLRCSGTFWQRHGFGRLTRRGEKAEPTVKLSSYMSVQAASHEMARRAPAHVEDTIQAVLRGPVEVNGPESFPPAALLGDQAYFRAYEEHLDWQEPLPAGQPSVTVSSHRQQKWDLQKQKMPADGIDPVGHVYGFDIEEAAITDAAHALEDVAGGGVGVASQILEAPLAWQVLLPLAHNAEAACFEMPKEQALTVAIRLADAARLAEAESGAKAEEARKAEVSYIEEAEKTADETASLSLERAKATVELRRCSCALLASAAARARDAHGPEFPIEGFEALASTGLGWIALKDIFFAALWAHLIRTSAEAPLRREIEETDASTLPLETRRPLTMSVALAKRLTKGRRRCCGPGTCHRGRCGCCRAVGGKAANCV